MRRGRRALRAVLALPLLAPLAWAAAVVPAVPAAAAAPAAGTVQMRIDDVTPSVAPRSTDRRPLRITVTLTNTGSTPISGVRLSGFRGDPIGNQSALDASIADTSPPTDGLAIPTARPVRLDLPATTPVTTTFASTISVLDDGGGVCQCHNAVYPVYLVASLTGSDGQPDVLAAATTYVPSQVSAVTKVKVSWVWPLIDRPHRLGDDRVFTDDDLAASVSGGRLDRMLEVVERLDPAIPITLVVDPELLDELEVMATGQYSVRTTDAQGAVTTEPGTGQLAARTWLQRFGALLLPPRAVQVSLTPYADPDVQSLARADLTWDTTLPTGMQQRVNTALRDRAGSMDVAWPAGGSLSRKALDALASSGASTLIVDGSALRPARTSGVPVALARLATSSGAVTAAATSPVMQRQVAEAVTDEIAAPSGSTVLPYLVAEIVVRAVQSGQDDSYAVLAPPRYADPDPDRAVRAIQDTSLSAYAQPVAVRELAAGRPTRSSTLAPTSASGLSSGLPPSNIAAVDDVSESQSALGALLAQDGEAAAVVPSLARAAQQVSSSAWRRVANLPFSPTLGPALATQLDGRVDRLLTGVRIVRPSSGSYTLGSEDSSLPITVENRLPYTVEVNLTVAAQDGLPGYSMRDIGPQRIAANSKQTVQVPSKLERSGRIAVDAQLTTPDGQDLGSAVPLYIRGTVFGTIGIVITVVAGGVLVLALLVRFVRRVQRMRRKAAQRETSEPPRRGPTVGTAAT